MKRALILMILSCRVVSTVTAQDPGKVAPKHYKVAEVSGSISPDGRYLSYEGATGPYDDVFALDLKTGERRRLTNASSEGETGETLISADGQQVIYAWLNYKDGFLELHTVGIDGSGDRILYRTQNVRQIFLNDWSSDGKYVLATFLRTDGTSRYVLLSVADASVRVLKTFRWRPGLNKMAFSPDGRYIAYDFAVQQDPPNRDIVVLGVHSGLEVPLVKHPAIDRLLGWTPDGKQILFASDRAGRWGLWAIEVADGKPRKFPKVVKTDTGPIDQGLRLTRDGSLYYSRQAWVNDVYLAALDLSAGKLHGLKKLVEHVRFDSSVDWSPDGQYLAYTSGRGWWWDDPLILAIRSVDNAKERRFRLKMTGVHAFQPRWSSDGRSLLTDGWGLSFRQGLYRIDAQTGEVTALAQAEPYPRGCALCMEWPVWTPDGKAIYWRHNITPRSIVVRDLATGGEKELYRTVSSAAASHLALSPDGQRLAFLWWNSETGETALKVMPTSGGEPSQLVKLSAPELARYGQPLFAAAWTPDSRHLIYAPSTAGQEPKLEFWRISADGGEPQSLGMLVEGVWPYGISVHPDGRRIAFTAGTEARDEVWVLKGFLPAHKNARNKQK